MNYKSTGFLILWGTFLFSIIGGFSRVAQDISKFYSLMHSYAGGYIINSASVNHGAVLFLDVFVSCHADYEI